MESRATYQDDPIAVPVHVRDRWKKKNSQLTKRRPATRFWTTLVHILTTLTIAVAVLGDDLVWLGPIFVTAAIYLYFGDKSQPIAYQARQALAVQLIGTVGWFVVLISGIMAWVAALLLAIASMLLLIGFILTPIVAILLPFFIVATFMIPVSAFVFGGIGALHTYRGEEFRYPFVADWLDRIFDDAPRPMYRNIRYV